MKTRIILFFMILLGLWSCIENIDLDLKREIDYLVIEGEITNLPGPYRVKIKNAAAYTKNYQNDFPVEFPVSGATVTIEGSDGSKENLTEIVGLKGSYTTKATTQGKVGVSYKVIVKTIKGKTYESIAEKLMEAPALENVESSFKALDKTNIGGNFLVNFTLKDPSSQENYYRYDYSGWNSVEVTLFDPVRRRSLQCIGGNNSFCYFSEEGKDIFISSDALRNGGTINELALVLPYTEIYDYLINARVHSISKNAYTFWKNVQDQSRKTGGITDKLPAQIVGNLRCMSNPEEPVLGYFEVSGVSTKKARVKRNIVNHAPAPRNEAVPVCYCKDSTDPRYPNIRSEVPTGW
jgi:hypothetical protein